MWREKVLCGPVYVYLWDDLENKSCGKQYRENHAIEVQIKPINRCYFWLVG